MHLRSVTLLVALSVLPLAGCMGDDGDATDDVGGADNSTMDGGDGGDGNVTLAPPPESLSVSTSGTYPVDPGYSPSELTATEGANVTVDFTNADSVPAMMHDWVLEGVDGAATDVIGAGESTSVTFTAPAAGTYAFFCSVGDHRARGMEGTFTVTAA